MEIIFYIVDLVNFTSSQFAHIKVADSLGVGMEKNTLHKTSQSYSLMFVHLYVPWKITIGTFFFGDGN